MRTINEVKEFFDSNDLLHGYVRLELVSASPLASMEPQTAADALVTDLGFAPIGRLAWRVLSSSEAIELLKNMLHRTLAYHQELLPLKTAEHVASALVSGLSRYRSEFMANGNITPDEGADWTPIGTTTFEMAVIGYDETHAFLLYAEDED